MSEVAVYTRNNPFASTVLVNRLETSPASEKETRHIELSLDPVMRYTPGDSVGIVPEMSPVVVAEVLTALGFDGTEMVKDWYGVEITLAEAMRTRLALGKLMKSTVTYFAKATGNAALASMLIAENRSVLDKYLWGREFIDIAHEFPGAIKDPQELFKAVGRLTPRLYSIASSQLAHPQSLYTIVRVIKYSSHDRQRLGVCSGLLDQRAIPGTHLPVFLHSNNNFRMPASPATPLIMVGPGTGVAPFRAFLEEREALGLTGNTWLFFGDQRAASDFLYQSDFDRWLASGVLSKLSTAFSRDQAQKIYIQHRMAEHSAELFDWLERGACFYVCGDAERMAVDVQQTLLDAIATHSGKGADYATEYLYEMKKQKRYQRDVY